MIKHSDITVIIPVHEWNGNVEKLFGEAVKSVPKDIQIIVSTTSKIAKEGWANKYKIVKHDKSTSFQSLVNAGVNEVKTEWFSILEFDDEYSPIWFDNFIKYQEYNQQYNIHFSGWMKIPANTPAWTWIANFTGIPEDKKPTGGATITSNSVELQLNALGYIQTAVAVEYETRVYVEISW